jgi:hypothetical protein
MKDQELIMIVLAFVFGFMLQGMMKNMCGGRLIEGGIFNDIKGVGSDALALAKTGTKLAGYCYDRDCVDGQICSDSGHGTELAGGSCVDKLACSKKIPAIGCVKDAPEKWVQGVLTNPLKSVGGTVINTHYTNGEIDQIDPETDKIARALASVVSTGHPDCWCPGDESGSDEDVLRGTCRIGLTGDQIEAGQPVTKDYGCVCEKPLTDSGTTVAHLGKSNALTEDWGSGATYPCV